ncbi:hypothetical protein J9317_16680 [Metabacillus sp. KIGAM252]|uniref:Uncharacterized protein n=1 Tax=Metabacillus flavus TaxID=2823519 RepID=A0ABS5LJ43_9BACI|nr:hypothetical protein [Metabacillus flavus]MBS2970384.1 hypothetical protein [Metabacillus flavus]
MKQTSHGVNMFLQQAYDAFYEIFLEVFEEAFWGQNPYYRYSRLKDAICIYVELLHHKPLKIISEFIESLRGQIDGLLVKELFVIIRHLISHFPFYKCWDEVWFTKSLVTWDRVGKIHKFFDTHSGGGMRYTFIEKANNKESSVTIWLPENYKEDKPIYLKDIIPERDGMKVCLYFMTEVLSTQFPHITVKPLSD